MIIACSSKRKKILPWPVELAVSYELHPLVDVDEDSVYDVDDVVFPDIMCFHMILFTAYTQAQPLLLTYLLFVAQ